MRRGGHLKRRAPMRRGPPRRLKREMPGESAYKAWLHLQPCVATGYVGEEIQASHMGRGGTALKAGSWFDAVPMRWTVHLEWGLKQGRFRAMTREQRDGYARAAIEGTRWRWSIQHTGEVPPWNA